MSESYTVLAAQVYDTIEGVPTNLSGNNMLAVVDRARISVETYTGRSVGSPYIDDKYKAAVFYLTCSHAARTKAIYNNNGDWSIGDLSVDNSSSTTSNESVADGFDKLAMRELLRLGGVSRYGRTW